MSENPNDKKTDSTTKKANAEHLKDFAITRPDPETKPPSARDQSESSKEQIITSTPTNSTNSDEKK